MAVNRHTIRIIIDTCCPSLKYNQALGQYVLHFPHISDDLFAKMRTRARRIGQKIDDGDVDSFIRQLSVSIPSDIDSYILPSELLAGEIIRITATDMKQIELVKMSDCNALVLKSQLEGVDPGSYMSLYHDISIKKDSTITIGTNKLNISLVELIQPSPYGHRLLDSVWAADLPQHYVTDNIWPLFRTLEECVRKQRIESDYPSLINQFATNGLSTFLLRRLLDVVTLQNKR